MSRLSTMSAEAEERLSKLYKDSRNSIVWLAGEFGISRATVYSVLERTNTPLRCPQKQQKRDSPRHQTKITNIKKTVELTEQNMSNEEIAKELGVQPQTVYNYRRQAKRIAQREAANGAARTDT